MFGLLKKNTIKYGNTFKVVPSSDTYSYFQVEGDLQRAEEKAESGSFDFFLNSFENFKNVYFKKSPNSMALYVENILRTCWLILQAKTKLLIRRKNFDRLART
jgi:hypothetical protein